MSVRISVVLLLVVLLSSASVPITGTNAEVAELTVSPPVVVQGENISVSGRAAPYEAVWINSSFELVLPVSNGTYYREFNGLKFPLGNKSLSVTVSNIATIGVTVSIGSDTLSLGPIDATDGVATISRSLPLKMNGFEFDLTECDLKVYGDTLEGATSVIMEFTMSVCVTADATGYFALYLSTSGVPVGDYVLSANGLQKTVQVVASLPIFDTGSGMYPSTSGVHGGSIKPNKTLNVSTLYTYTCPGTGGHTVSIQLREHNELIAYGEWEGYQSDWHNVTLYNVSGAPYVTLYADHEYTYTICTESYPQIIHKQQHTTVDGSSITCTSFVDANGKVYYDWIPAIKLIGDSS